jgi:anti-sigma regulatory factor (Ser/Thr protein kinase)
VSELVTNAVVASGAMTEVRPVRLWLASDGARALILVGDQSTRPLLRVAPETDADSGRGLLLVEATSDRWGWYPATGNGLAKVVWAELAARWPPTATTGREPGAGAECWPAGAGEPG